MKFFVDTADVAEIRDLADAGLLLSFAMQKPGDRKYNSNEIAGFVQDDWRIHDRVRLNLGFRYDFNTNLRDNEF